MITISAPLAIIALKMGPVEIAALIIFAFSVLTGLVGSSLVKGVISALVGLLGATVGADPENYTPRFIMGHFELYEGFPLISVAIGSLAVSEILRRLATSKGGQTPAIIVRDTGNKNDSRVTWEEYWGCRYVMLRGATIGTIFGALPGVGSTAAAFMSYLSTKTRSKDPDSFGKGNIQGIAAAESANSAVVGANLIPLLTLGIPGSVGAALIISAFMIHGIQPGPLLFRDQGQLIYGLFGAMIMANFINLWVGQLGLRIWVKVISAPESIIFSSALLLCIVGVWMATGGIFGLVVLLAFAILGYLMTAFGYSVVIFMIAFFLGKQFEIVIAQGLAITNGEVSQLLSHPVALILLLLAAFTFLWFTYKNRKAPE